MMMGMETRTKWITTEQEEAIRNLPGFIDVVMYGFGVQTIFNGEIGSLAGVRFIVVDPDEQAMLDLAAALKAANEPPLLGALYSNAAMVLNSKWCAKIETST